MPGEMINFLYVASGRRSFTTNVSAFPDWLNFRRSFLHPTTFFFRHADGSVKFWDASAGTLQILYKLKTAKVFEKPRARSADGAAEDDPFAIQLISLCPESRKLCIAGASAHVVLFKFKKLESTSETTVCISYLISPTNCVSLTEFRKIPNFFCRSCWQFNSISRDFPGNFPYHIYIHIHTYIRAQFSPVHSCAVRKMYDKFTSPGSFHHLQLLSLF